MRAAERNYNNKTTSGASLFNRPGASVFKRRSQGERGKYRRTPFVSAISKDEGRSWVQQRVIAGDPNDDYGYPSLTFMDEVALISYHKRDGLYVAHVPVDWFYGK